MPKPLQRSRVFDGEDPDFTFELSFAELASDVREYSVGDDELDASERGRMVIVLPLSAPAPQAESAAPPPLPAKKRSKATKNAPKTA